MEVADSILTEEKAPKASFRSLFKYATALDYLLIALGSMGAIGMGILQPIFFLLMADYFNGMGPNTSSSEFYDDTLIVVYYLIGCGVIFTFAGWIAVMCWVIVGARQAASFREQYFECVLNTDPGLLDSKTIAEIPTSIASDTLKIERATGDKLVILIFTSSMITAAYIMGIILGTQLTLVTLTLAPLMVGGLYFMNSGVDQSAKASDTSYKQSSGIAEEVLQEIKTVASLNGQKHETRKYINSLEASRKHMMISGLKTGAGVGTAMLGFYLLMAVTYMVGAKFMNERIDNWVDGKRYDVGKIVVVLFIGILAFSNMGSLLPGVKMIVEGQVAAGRVFQTINQKSKLAQGSLKSAIEGQVKFDNIVFSYPSAKEVIVLKGLSFKLKAGERLGIVGSTGSGKSTVIQLLLRYYEQNSGTIYIDGVDIREYDIQHLRNSISVVSQEPVLFNTTIYENIRYGRLDSTKEEIESAAKMAGAMEFINKLPDSFETVCGNKGSQLSGGQKQRIAIARAIVRNPKILLLDEATSALDRRTEQFVVEALEKSFPDCTRIAIAQNILTVKDYTRIIMIEKGELIEKGSHNRLMKKQGKYYHLFKMQELQMSSSDTGDAKAQDEDIKNAAEEEKIDEAEQKQLKSAAFKNVMLLGRSEKWWLLLGCLGSIAVGFFVPLTGMMSALEISTLGGTNEQSRFDNSIRYGWILIVFGVIAFFGMMVEAVAYPRMGSNITRKIREMSFKALVSFDSAFYDVPSNNCSILTSRLNNDCEKVNGLGGSIVGIILGLISSVAVAVGASSFYAWRMALVVLSILPLMIFAITSNFMAQMVGIVKFDYDSLSIIASDAILNYRTTKAFNLEGEMKKRYLDPLRMQFRATSKKACSSGFAYGLGFAVLFFVYALLFWYGAKLVKDGTNSFEDMITAMLTAIVATDGFFQAGVFAPDIKNGIDAGKRLFKMLEHVPAINVNSKEGIKSQIEGKIEFSDVNFSYPNRTYMALKEVSFVLNPGQSLGIIGRTGSGKSTIMQLLLRQYDVTSGKLKIDGKNIIEYNVKYLRSHISIVSQEPILFSGSIRDNIAYGIKATDEEVIDAATKAQAITFIEDHQDGFEREVGIKGSQLSGGQKQRVAIARAIIRKPKILLMDEATSALDSSTEMEVLTNIRGLMKEATCITVAHRLKTIDSCEFVLVMESGRVLEIGEREELKVRGGYYTDMVASL